MIGQNRFENSLRLCALRLSPAFYIHGLKSCTSLVMLMQTECRGTRPKSPTLGFCSMALFICLGVKGMCWRSRGDITVWKRRLLYWVLFSLTGFFWKIIQNFTNACIRESMPHACPRRIEEGVRLPAAGRSEWLNHSSRRFVKGGSFWIVQDGQKRNFWKHKQVNRQEPNWTKGNKNKTGLTNVPGTGRLPFYVNEQ